MPALLVQSWVDYEISRFIDVFKHVYEHLNKALEADIKEGQGSSFFQELDQVAHHLAAARYIPPGLSFSVCGVQKPE